MNYKRVLDCIIDIGEAMVNSGAEISRVEDSMYRLCRSYGFVRVNCWTIATNIQMTVESPDGEILTQIRYVTGREMDFDRLDYLNDLCRKACAKTPDAAQLKESLTKVMERPGKPKWEHYLAGIMGGVGFAALLPRFFGLDGVLYSMPVSDILTFAASAYLIAKTIKQLSAQSEPQHSRKLSAAGAR